MSVLSDRGLDILKHLASLPDGDDDADVVAEDIRCFVGNTPIHRRTLDHLLRCTAVSESWRSGNAVYYRINETGRAITRRPELADEVYAAILSGRGAFTIQDDRIVMLEGAE